MMTSKKVDSNTRIHIQRSNSLRELIHLRDESDEQEEILLLNKPKAQYSHFKSQFIVFKTYKTNLNS